ncbi:MAG TPA: M67 family metallopeptidase [Candidatus Eremiobacteraceae bacterium]|nr:M67 family metallopeptidase [Candidatus Eremiobacteraceae bacterium]
MNISDSPKVFISAELAEKIRLHGVETYPHECCGALLGRESTNTHATARPREILDLFPLINRRDDSPRNRFSITPRDVIEADRSAQARGLDVVGWYHSHPDHPAKPSEYDREHAWPWYSYIIVSVHERIPQDMTSWRLRDDRAAYTQENIEIRREPCNT